MSPQKLAKFNEVYQKYIDTALGDFSLDAAKDFIAEDVMGYGTNLDEKVSSFLGFRQLVTIQREQSLGIEMRIERAHVSQKFENEGNAGTKVEEFVVIMNISGAEHKVHFRLSSVLYYVNENWRIIHWHASVPVVANADDTWNLDELNRKNKELQKLVEERTAELNKSLEELKATQSQLIQQEKMASLGELTAGIAHEIQNPLNFVNNFSEVNRELLSEMNEEIEKGNLQEARLIAKDIIDNEEKINHHGKRADVIVKGMLQHSRSSTAVKESTDINKLADEYLRLAYHGLKAKDNSFNATMKTDFDETIGKINIVPQEIGRVILNLITNAFYAVTEKKKQEPDSYEPIVTVSTKSLASPVLSEVERGDGGKVEIKVSDNGNGIPQKVLDKIFQPFFTTKPTGHGTGLGLSLSYDIVKAHGGEIKVETKEGEGASFIISIPTIHT